MNSHHGKSRTLGIVATVGVVLGALAEQALSDPIGDSGVAPDISAVTVSNDAGGTITVAVTTAQQQLSPDASVLALFDTDSNPATGFEVGGLGADYFIIADGAGTAFLAEVQGKLTIIHLSSSATSSFAAGRLTIRVNRADLGGAARFGFLIDAEQSDADRNTLGSDYAPDGPPFPVYQLASSAVTLSLGKPRPLGGGPTAGKRFVVATQVARSDTQPFASGSVSCVARAGSASLKPVGSVSSGSARCSMTIPKGTARKTLRGSLTVSAEGASRVTRSFVFRIR
jgi:hypothetical protein